MALPRPLDRSAARLALAVLLAVAAGTASAEGVRTVGYGYGAPYGGGYGGYGGYGFADEAVRGAYVGAPFTSVPSPNRIVPAPWSYGTYGVPTISGIRQAAVAAPSVTVINPGARPAPRRSSGARILSRDGGGGWTRTESEARQASGANVIAVTVPRR